MKRYNKVTPTYNIDYRLLFGCVVTRSDWWYKDRAHKILPLKDRQLGVVTGVEFFQIKPNFPVECWPVIHWEGTVTDSLTHPCNAVPFRNIAVTYQTIPEEKYETE